MPDPTPIFVFDSSPVSRDILLARLYDMQEGDIAVVVYDGTRYRIRGYGIDYEKSRYYDKAPQLKIVLDDILKFTPEALIEFMINFNQR